MPVVGCKSGAVGGGGGGVELRRFSSCSMALIRDGESLWLFVVTEIKKKPRLRRT